MACLKQKSLLDLPDEVLEKVMTFLSFSDLYKLRKLGKRLADSTERVLKKKPFDIAIIGGINDSMDGTYLCLEEFEVISILKDSMSQSNSLIPSLATGLARVAGAQLPNGDLMISGGCYETESLYTYGYYHYKKGSNQWQKVGTMNRAREGHSSVFIDGGLFTTGGYFETHLQNGSWCGSHLSSHEEFSIKDGMKLRKEMPIGLSSHTATVFGKHTMLICGGKAKDKISRRTFMYDVKEHSWLEGPSLLTARCNHSSCAIQSNDGSTKCIIIIGGMIFDRSGIKAIPDRKTTEILYVTEQKWVQGPRLPVEVGSTACVALPPTSNFACVIVVNSTTEESSLYVYGLDKNLSEWTLLGRIEKGRLGYIALPIS